MKDTYTPEQSEIYMEGYKAGITFTTETAERAFDHALAYGDPEDTSVLSYTGAIKFALSIIESLKWTK